MRRADRLFDLIQLLRHGKVVRARELAEVLEVSERTIYRDISDLIGSGVPIDGEAGVGYVLRSGFDMPPLMFTEAEIEALMLGARIVESWTDREMARAASDAIGKVEAVVPDRLRDHMSAMALLAPSQHAMEPLTFELADLRRAVREHLRVRFRYSDALGDVTERTIRPLSLAFFGPVWLLAAWCELRADFRTFRLDRIADFAVIDERFPSEPGKTLSAFLDRDRPWNRSRLDDPSSSDG